VSGAADFDGLNDYLTDNVSSLASYLSASGWGIHMRALIRSVPADPGAGSRYLIGALLADGGANFVLAPHSGGVTLECADGIGAASTLTVACGTGVWRDIQARYNGTQLQLRVDGGAWSSQTYGSIGNLAFVLRMGANYNASVACDVQVKGLLTTAYSPTDAEANGIRSYLATL
jgi:hypothetical protein